MIEAITRRKTHKEEALSRNSTERPKPQIEAMRNTNPALLHQISIKIRTNTKNDARMGVREQLPLGHDYCAKKKT